MSQVNVLSTFFIFGSVQITEIWLSLVLVEKKKQLESVLKFSVQSMTAILCHNPTTAFWRQYSQTCNRALIWNTADRGGDTGIVKIEMGGALLVEEGVLSQWEEGMINNIKDIWKVHRETFYKIMQKYIPIKTPSPRHR